MITDNKGIEFMKNLQLNLLFFYLIQSADTGIKNVNNKVVIFVSK